MFYLVSYNSKYNPIKIIKSNSLEALKLNINSSGLYNLFSAPKSFRLPSESSAKKAASSLYISTNEYLETLISKYCEKLN